MFCTLKCSKASDCQADLALLLLNTSLSSDIGTSVLNTLWLCVQYKYLRLLGADFVLPNCSISYCWWENEESPVSTLIHVERLISSPSRISWLSAVDWKA